MTGMAASPYVKALDDILEAQEVMTERSGRGAMP
jgi:hypothetical protein